MRKGPKNARVCVYMQVTAGTPVFGELQKDDIILELQNCDAMRLTHKQAQDMIRNAGGSMLVRVRRSATSGLSLWRQIVRRSFCLRGDCISAVALLDEMVNWAHSVGP